MNPPENYNGVYDFDSFTLGNGQSNYSLKTNRANLFKNLSIARKVFIWSDQTISFAFNSTTLPAIPLVPSNGESPFQGRDMLNVNDIFLTNSSGNTANIKVFLAI